MPCDSGMGGYLSSGTDYEARRQVELLTRVSCDIMRAIEATGMELPVSKETAQWWERHKEIDRLREQKELAEKQRAEAQQAALSKLTLEERSILGLR